jgi:hypothetical protein
VVVAAQAGFGVMVFVWAFICTFAAVLAEIVFGSYGLIVPVFSVTAFYFLVLLDWRQSVPLLLVLGSALDLVFGRRFPCELVVVPVLVPLALGWRRHGDCIHRVAQMIPGLVVGAVSASAALVLVRLPGAGLTWDFAWRNALIFAEFAVGGALGLPLISALLDRLAARFDLPRFDSVQKMLG